ncbi:L-asparaginase II [Aureimonas jatrophae]|nr:L-asparaginase II [Aureimonas jatrophae]
MSHIVIEATRGNAVESVHLVSAAVVDGSGRALATHGDVATPIYPRSAIKVMQALPLVESGAADRFGFGAKELALACASHSGESSHVGLAADILQRAGLGEADLECGCHWPFDQKVAIALAQSGETPTQLHNNCSGKHAGFLCTAVHLGEETRGYVAGDHPVQRRARQAIADLTNTAVGDATPSGIDGCSIPTYAAPLQAFALGFARLASGTALPDTRARAGQRLMAACMAEPFFMAGTDRACVALMEAAPGRVFAKTGAEGVFCGAVPELGFGFALKAHDGGTRAAESAVARLIADILRGADRAIAERYDELSRHSLRNWEGTKVGEVRPRQS